MGTEAILDRILTQRHAQDIRAFDPVGAVDRLLRELSEREQEIIARRFALAPEAVPATLEEIGSRFKVTRERVRQVIKGALEKLRAQHAKHDDVVRLVRVSEQLLLSFGGALEEQFFLRKLLELLVAAPVGQRHVATHLEFLVREVAADAFEYRPATHPLRPVYAVRGVDDAFLRQVVATLVSVVEASGQPLGEAALVDRFRQTPFYGEHRRRMVEEPLRTMRGYAGDELEATPTPEDEQQVLAAYLHAAAPLNRNVFDEWGRFDWPTIRPRRMNEKIYLVLRRHGKPLHFTEISEHVNAAQFDRKVAKPPSVHNELILDGRFVLIGRGTYALKEWGYERGTVADVVEAILRAHPEGVARERLIEEVMRRRLVKRQTVQLALMNRDRFRRGEDGRYRLTSARAGGEGYHDTA
jgi:hypothetical protein